MALTRSMTSEAVNRSKKKDFESCRMAVSFQSPFLIASITSGGANQSGRTNSPGSPARGPGPLLLIVAQELLCSFLGRIAEYGFRF